VRRAELRAVYGDTHLATILHAAGGARSFTCEAPADVDGGVQRCVEILASYLAEAPKLAPPADRPPEERGASAAVGARTIPLPAGCRSESLPPGGRVACAAAVVVWRPFATADEARAAAAEEIAPFDAIANAVVARDVACRFAGEPATCAVATVEGEPPAVLVAVVATIDGAPIAATCRASAYVDDVSVCGGLLALKGR
jgi:hypothetical protein